MARNQELFMKQSDKNYYYRSIKICKYFSIMLIQSIPSAQSSSGTGYCKLDYLHFPLTILDHHQRILLDIV